MMDKGKVRDETPEELIRRYKSPESMNTPDTLADQLQSLEEVGFIDVVCYYKNGIFALFGGRKA